MKQPAMFLHDRIADRQTEAARERFGREIRIENFRRNLRRDSVAAIGDGNLDVATGGQGRFALAFDLTIFRFQPHRAAVRHGVARIQHQRVHHLLDLIGVDFGFPEDLPRCQFRRADSIREAKIRTLAPTLRPRR